MNTNILTRILSLALALSITQSNAQSWSLTGNAGTIPGAQFLGTTDNNALVLKVNGHAGLVIVPSDNCNPGTVNIIAGSVNNFVAPGFCGATISGGGADGAEGNVIDADGSFSVIGGGLANTTRAGRCTIGGGYNNRIETNSFSATIDGGDYNSIEGHCNHATIGGGNANVIGYYSYGATIAGGRSNRIGTLGFFSTIGGGQQNTALDDATWATIGGGRYNMAGGDYSTVPGGRNNEATGRYSFAAGFYAKAYHDGSFVWNNASGGAFASTADNQFLIRATGGVGIGTASPQAALDVNGQIRSTTLLLTSDRNAKTNFLSVDSHEILKKVATLPLSTWHYTNAPGVRHLGPMAQDFKAAFPEVGEDDKHIATVDADGVALASIQALHKLVQEKDSQIAELQRQASALETELVELKDSLSYRLAALEQAMSKNVLQASFHSKVQQVSVLVQREMDFSSSRLGSTGSGVPAPKPQVF